MGKIIFLLQANTVELVPPKVFRNPAYGEIDYAFCLLVFLKCESCIENSKSWLIRLYNLKNYFSFLKNLFCCVMVSLEEAKKIVLRFIEKTIVYAEKHIEKIQDIGQYPKEEQEYRRKRLEAWQSYVEFQKHTIKEIQEGKLDDWFN